MEYQSQLREVVITNILGRHSLKEVYDLWTIFLSLDPLYGEIRIIRDNIARLPVGDDPAINMLIKKNCDLYFLSLCADDNLTKTGKAILAEDEALGIIHQLVEANQRIENDLPLRILIKRALLKVSFKGLHKQFSTEDSLAKLILWVETFDPDGGIVSHFKNYRQKILAA
jgi:hypothetical protein